MPRSCASARRTRSSTSSPTTGPARPTSSRAGSVARCGAGSTAASWWRPATSAPTWSRCSAPRTTRGRSPSGPWPGAARSRRSSARTRRSSRSGRPSRPSWGRPRELRWRQPHLEISEPPQVEPDPQVRRTTRADLDELYPACVAMYTEEVGVSPEAGGGAELYRARVSQLISRGWSFARFDEGRLVFKAEVACASPQAAQIQGVYVPPDRRGQGLAVAGMAAVVAPRPAARRAGRLPLRQRLERAGSARLRAGRVHPVGDVLDGDVLTGSTGARSAARSQSSRTQRAIVAWRLPLTSRSSACGDSKVSAPNQPWTL